MRIQVQEGRNSAVWPSLNGSVKVDKNGPPHTINKKVATYTVTADSLSKKFSIECTEVDKGTLGQDDIGQSTLTFDLTPDMKPSTKTATISLKRPNMKKYNGKAKIVMSAQRV
jgi:hypothetical protein